MDDFGNPFWAWFAGWAALRRAAQKECFFDVVLESGNLGFFNLGQFLVVLGGRN